MTPEEWAIRRERAIAQLDLVIDVLSAWSGSYRDDDAPATVRWIKEVIPQMADDPPRGWLNVGCTLQQGLGWMIRGGVFWLLRASGGQFWMPPEPIDTPPHSCMTRRAFRAIARKEGVCLPSRHATLCLKEG